MRYLRNLKVWGLGIFLMVLLFTTVFSQERSTITRTGGAAAETPVAADPSGKQESAISSRSEAGANSGPAERPSSLSELTARIRKSMKEHPVLTNLYLAGALLGIILVNLAIRQVFLYGLQLMFKKIPTNNNEYRKQVYATASRLAYIVPIVVVYLVVEAVNVNPENLVFTRKICMVLTLICAVAATISLLNILDIWYMRHSNTHDRSIKGGIQLIQLFAVLVAIIMIASILMNKSPVMLLSGLGAVAAVLILIFQDTILALVSGIQLSTNHMIRLGDWIELPSENVDGIIVDIALHTVKVQNWDMTIVTVPTRKLTVETFINWEDRKTNMTNGTIYATTAFTDSLGKVNAKVSVHKSQLTFNDTIWQVAPSRLQFYDKRIVCSDLQMFNEHQSIVVNGAVSEHPSDSLIVDLNNIEVAYITDIVDFDAVNFKGQASGRAQISNIYNDTHLNANLIVNNMHLGWVRVTSRHFGTTKSKASE